MFEDGKEQFNTILELVKLCPEKLQEKCFEILLNAYVGSLTMPRSGTPASESEKKPLPSTDDGTSSQLVPEAIRPRLVSTAARLKISQEQLAGLFDFNVDPFSYHALAVPGENKKDKTKNVVFLLAAKNYLSGGAWEVDWKEFRAMCIDQNCFDTANNPTTMKADAFKSASPTGGIVLSSAGMKAAEALIAQLAGSAQ